MFLENKVSRRESRAADDIFFPYPRIFRREKDLSPKFYTLKVGNAFATLNFWCDVFAAILDGKFWSFGEVPISQAESWPVQGLVGVGIGAYVNLLLLLRISMGSGYGLL